MAQPPRQGIPPAPPDPNAGRNIHGQPNPRPDPNRPPNQPPEQGQPQPGQVNIHGQGPQPNMAPPPEDNQSGLADNTRAEMEAGKKNLQQYTKRDDAEHEAGRKVLQQHADRNLPRE
jgi:hypothetical protein